MNVGEANDVNVLLSYLAGTYASQVLLPDPDDDPPPTGAEAREAAQRLADRAFKALYAGWTGERLRQALRPSGLPRSDAEAEMLAGFRGDAEERPR